MTIVFSILRNIALTFLLWFSQVLPPPAGALNPLAPLPAFDVFVVDQQSVCVPFLRLLTGTPVVFYCHFPDKLLSGGWQITFGDEVNLSRNSGGVLKKAYRWPIDTLEEWTTGELLWTCRELTSRSSGRDPRQLQVHVEGVLGGFPLPEETPAERRVSLH